MTRRPRGRRIADRAGGGRSLHDGHRSDDRDGARRIGGGAQARSSTVDRAAASALALGEASQGFTKPAREHRAEAIEVLDQLPDEELTASLEAFYYIAWVENYLELYDESLAHIDRAIAISRSTGQGRLVIPLMLTKGYPLELQGRLAEAAEMCDAAVEAARLPPTPTSSIGPSSNSASLVTSPATSKERSPPARRASISATGSPARPSRQPAGGPAGRSR